MVNQERISLSASSKQSFDKEESRSCTLTKTQIYQVRQLEQFAWQFADEIAREIQLKARLALGLSLSILPDID